MDPTTVLHALPDEVPDVGEAGRSDGAPRPVTWAEALENRRNASRIRKLVDAYLTRLEDLEGRYDAEADVGRVVPECAGALDTLWAIAPRVDVPQGEADLRDVLAWSRELFEDLTKQAHGSGTPVVHGRDGCDPPVSRSDFDRLHTPPTWR